jgi:PST family polysaccharide transporter
VSGTPVGTDPAPLGRQAARGGAVTMGGQLLKVGVQAVSIVVLARLLAPEAFGYLAMVLALVGVAETVRDFGLANAAVQAKTLSDAERDNLFWLNTLIGAVLTGAGIVCAPLVAAFYGQPELADVTRWVSLSFLLNAVATQHRASLVRGMRLGAAAVADVAGPVAGLCVAILVAVAGGGYWALVAQQLVGAFVMSVGVIAAGRWVPGPPRRDVSVRPFVRYGSNLLGAQLLGYATRNIDTAILGVRFGAGVAGLYSRVYQLMALPIRQATWPANRVALPVLSRVHDDPARYREFLLFGQTILLHTIVPALMLAAALAGPVVDVVLGERWSSAAPAFAILAVGGVFEAAGFAPGWVFQSAGRTGALLRFTLVTRPVVLLAIGGGSFFGMTGAALGYAASTAVVWPLGLWWVGRVTEAPARALFWNGVRAFVSHGAGAAAAGLVASRLADLGSWPTLAVGLLVWAGVVALQAVLWRRLRTDLGVLLRGARLLSRKGAAREPSRA